MKTNFLLTLGLLCGVVFPASAQNAAAQNEAPSTPYVDSHAVPEVSLARLLQLDAAQIANLGRLAARIDAPRAGEVPTQQMATDWRLARSKARAILPPVQRSQLDAFASDPRFRLRHDDLYWLLMAPAAPAAAQNWRQSAKLPIPISSEAQSRRNWQDAPRLTGEAARGLRGTGSYGVYGGTGTGGPQVGVYGGYQQGAIGVYGGLGRGGPSIGVNIGRVFGLGRR